MNSYFLEGLAKPEHLAQALNEILPGQQNPWLMKSGDHEPLAYFHLDEGNGLQVDVSGRCENPSLVVAVLKTIQDRVGGNISGDA